MMRGMLSPKVSSSQPRILGPPGTITGDIIFGCHTEEGWGVEGMVLVSTGKIPGH